LDFVLEKIYLIFDSTLLTDIPLNAILDPISTLDIDLGLD